MEYKINPGIYGSSRHCNVCVIQLAEQHAICLNKLTKEQLAKFRISGIDALPVELRAVIGQQFNWDTSTTFNNCESDCQSMSEDTEQATHEAAEVITTDTAAPKNKEGTNTKDSSVESVAESALGKALTDDNEVVSNDVVGTDVDLPNCKRMLSCTGCNLIKYCSREHQLTDWKFHKKFCQEMKQVKKLYNINHPLLINGPLNEKNLKLSIAQLKTILYIRLCRDLNKREIALLSYPVYCVVCYKLNQLQHCNQCFGISYCSEEHRLLDYNRHKEECCILRLHYTGFRLVTHKYDLIKDFHLCVPNLQNMDLFDAFEYTTRLQIPENPLKTYLHYHDFAVATSFSWIATICLVMSYIEVPGCRNDFFNIFIIGATNERDLYFQPMHMRFFFLHYGRIAKVKLHFIGPEAVPTDTEILCLELKGRSYTVISRTYVGLFQNFIKDMNITPNLIMAFHPDFSECCQMQIQIINECLSATQSTTTAATNSTPKNLLTWRDGIEQLLQFYKVPIFYTSNTELEAKLDYCALLEGAERCQRNVYVTRMLEFDKNPYADMIPQRNMRHGEPETIYYHNGYLQGFFTTLYH